MEAASHMDPRMECIGIDGISQAYPVLGSVFNKMYLQMLKRAPIIWDYLYDNPDIEEATREVRELLTSLSSFRIKRILKRYHPMGVVCTQAVPAIAMAAEKRRGTLKAPLIGVITDFGVHSYWYQPEIDLYLVGHEDIKQEMIRKGVKHEKIRVTGIPIRPKFGETFDAIEERHKLRLNPHKKIILLMGGSHGLGPLDEVVETLKTLPFPFQTVVVCGRNKRLYKQIMSVTKGSEDFHVLGYVKDTFTLMAAADLIITKPGGLTCSEALAMQVPMILTEAIPGQEERNLRFLTRCKVCRIAHNPEDLLHTITDLMRHPKKLLSLRQRAKLIAKPHSAWEAARLIFDLINRRGSFAQIYA